MATQSTKANKSKVSKSTPPPPPNAAPSQPDDVVEQVHRVPLNEIHADHAWNVRGDTLIKKPGSDEMVLAWKVGPGEGEEDDGYTGLLNSIKNTGQDDPVTLVPYEGKGKWKYSLVKGFRRYEAIKDIAAEAGDRHPTIKAFIKGKMSELEKRRHNIKENTARENLRGPDLAYGVHELIKNGLTDIAIASEIGKHQTYVSRLHRIVEKMTPGVMKRWRTDTVVPTTHELDALFKKKPELKDNEEGQLAEYDRIVKGKAKKGVGAEPSTEEVVKAWLENACEQAAKFGAILGKLDAQGVLRGDADKSSVMDFDAETIQYYVKLPKEFIPGTVIPSTDENGKKVKSGKTVTSAQKRKIASAAEKAYKEAFEEEEEPEEDAKAAQ